VAVVTIVKKGIFLLLVIFSLCSCISTDYEVLNSDIVPIVPQTDPVQGTGVVKGEFFGHDHGRLIIGAGEKVYLSPVNEKGVVYKRVKLVTTCNSEGKFVFINVPPGKWLVYASISMHDKEGDSIYVNNRKLILVEKDKETFVILSGSLYE
jgi:hypothetical protein